MLRSSIWTALTSALIISLGQASHIRVCAEDPTDNCLKPLEDVTIVAPAKGFVVAKVECLGCPAGLSGGDHEDNALFLNLTLSPSKKTLLLNSHSIYPPLSIPPPPISVPQIPLNFSVDKLASSIGCTKQPSSPLTGLNCIRPSLSTYDVSYDYEALPSWESAGKDIEKWTIIFDILGGDNGGEKYVNFSKEGQKVLVVEFDKHSNNNTLTLGSVKLTERVAKLPDSKKESAWTSIVRFFGFKSDAIRGPGHIVYDIREWAGGVRVGTFRYYGRIVLGRGWVALVVLGGVFVAWILVKGLGRTWVEGGSGQGKGMGMGEVDMEQGSEMEGLLMSDIDEEEKIDERDGFLRDRGGKDD